MPKQPDEITEHEQQIGCLVIFVIFALVVSEMINHFYK